MSSNQKKALALLVAFLISVIVGLGAAFLMKCMVDATSSRQCLALGGGVFLGVFFGSVKVIDLFDFPDTRPPAPPPAGNGP
ncbi:hypothetical protein ACFXPN_27105 [Streptomyces griseorubiginosus]|uniref:hypothetical protein n=1 Tax=Streptomyces griseorubiginosus TaxID=67304 RepID=UPI0036759F71